MILSFLSLFFIFLRRSSSVFHADISTKCPASSRMIHECQIVCVVMRREDINFLLKEIIIAFLLFVHLKSIISTSVH